MLTSSQTSVYVPASINNNREICFQPKQTFTKVCKKDIILNGHSCTILYQINTFLLVPTAHFFELLFKYKCFLMYIVSKPFRYTITKTRITAKAKTSILHNQMEINTNISHLVREKASETKPYFLC